MKLKYILQMILVFLILSGCTNNYIVLERENLEFPVTDSSDYVNIDFVISEAHELIKTWLPDANFASLTFTSSCEELPKAYGKIVILFIQERGRVFLSPQVLFGIASIDTQLQLLDLRISDESDYYPSKILYPVVKDSEFKSILNIAHSQIIMEGISHCDVTITQTENEWKVRCGALDELTRKCNFGIDPKTLEIMTP